MTALLALLLAGASSPATVQHGDHAAPARTSSSSASACTAEHAAMGHCTLAEQPKAAPPAPACTPEHARMGHCTLDEESSAKPPVPACTAEHAAMGHCTLPSGEVSRPDPQASHRTGGIAPALAPPPAEAMSGPAHAADLLFGAAEMARSREELRREHGDMPVSKLLVDRLEWRSGKGRNGYLMEMQGWYGGDINKLWLKAEVEGDRGRKPERVEVQALWSRAVDPWFDLQAGLRLDSNRGPDRGQLVLGMQGLAPYWWEVGGAIFLSNKGELTARAEAEYDLRITQKLILQPLAEIDLSAQAIDELGIGSGLSTAELGLRLRYQLSPQFAPYVGISYERAFGGTRSFRRQEGERAGALGLVAGLRLWL